LGEDDKHISTVEAEGVALAAIQALYQTVTPALLSMYFDQYPRQQRIQYRRR
jgi:hypothetical protein